MRKLVAYLTLAVFCFSPSVIFAGSYSGGAGLSSGTGGGNTTSTSLSVNTVPRADGAASLINSLLADDGTILQYAGAGGFRVQSLQINNSVNANKLILRAGTTQSNNLTFYLPSVGGTVGQGLALVGGDGVLGFSTFATSGNTTSTSLSTNTVPKANGANSVINSLIADDGTTLYYAGAGGFRGSSLVLTNSVNANKLILRAGTTQSDNLTFYMPSGYGAVGNVLALTGGNGVLGFAAAGSGNTTSTALSVNTVPKADGANSIVNSKIADDGTTMEYSGSGGIRVGGGSVNGQFIMGNTVNANLLTLQAGTTSANMTLYLPSNMGTVGQAVTLVGGNGVLGFGTVSATPAGSSSQLQFNNGGAFGASANLTWVSPVLSIGTAGGTTGQLQLLHSGTTATFKLQAGNTTSSYTMVVPTSIGLSGTVLRVNDAATGQLGFAASSGGATFNQVRMRHSTGVTLTNSTDTAIPFDTDVNSNSFMHSTSSNNTRLTIPNTSVCIIEGTVGTDTPGDTQHKLKIRLNGTTTIAQHAFQSSPQGTRAYDIPVQAIRQFTASDYVELVWNNGSGSNLTTHTNSEFSPIFSATCYNQ